MPEERVSNLERIFGAACKRRHNSAYPKILAKLRTISGHESLLVLPKRLLKIGIDLSYVCTFNQSVEEPVTEVRKDQDRKQHGHPEPLIDVYNVSKEMAGRSSDWSTRLQP